MFYVTHTESPISMGTCGEPLSFSHRELSFMQLRYSTPPNTCMSPAHRPCVSARVCGMRGSHHFLWIVKAQVQSPLLHRFFRKSLNENVCILTFSEVVCLHCKMSSKQLKLAFSFQNPSNAAIPFKTLSGVAVRWTVWTETGGLNKNLEIMHPERRRGWQFLMQTVYYAWWGEKTVTTQGEQMKLCLSCITSDLPSCIPITIILHGVAEVAAWPFLHFYDHHEGRVGR